MYQGTWNSRYSRTETSGRRAAVVGVEVFANCLGAKVGAEFFFHFSIMAATYTAHLRQNRRGFQSDSASQRCVLFPVAADVSRRSVRPQLAVRLLTSAATTGERGRSSFSASCRKGLSTHYVVTGKTRCCWPAGRRPRRPWRSPKFAKDWG